MCVGHQMSKVEDKPLSSTAEFSSPPKHPSKLFINKQTEEHRSSLPQNILQYRTLIDHVLSNNSALKVGTIFSGNRCLCEDQVFD